MDDSEPTIDYELIVDYQKSVIHCLRVQVESLRAAISMLIRAMDNEESAADLRAPAGYTEIE